MSRTLKYHDESFSNAIVLIISESVKETEKLKKVALILKKRFNLELTLAFSSPDYFYLNRGLINFAMSGDVDRLWITNKESEFRKDLIQLTKRHECEAITLIDSNDLMANWLDVLKFFVEYLDAKTDFCISANSKIFRISKEYIRSMQSINEYLCDISLFVDDLISRKKRSNKVNLFVTNSGLHRFGGLDAFLKCNLLIGGLSPKNYSRIWVVDNDYSMTDYFRDINKNLKKSTIVKIPGIIEVKDSDDVLITDINPVDFEVEASKDDSFINVSRVCLHFKKINIHKNKSNSESLVVFIMSNFNKESYIYNAIYSVVMQTHKYIKLVIVDDISTDNSIFCIKSFKSLFDNASFPIDFSINEVSRGTYWIRNKAIHENSDVNGIYLINDSDDYSVSQRAFIQNNLLNNDAELQVAFGDIIRVNEKFDILPLDGKVERYGTASLGSKFKTNAVFGYYENIKKNADTEFIERIKYFGSKKSIKWFRYPVLFQPFDGNNLTADIYSYDAKSESIKQQLNKREVHVMLFKERHSNTSFKDLPRIYSHDKQVFPEKYHSGLDDFLF